MRQIPDLIVYRCLRCSRWSMFLDRLFPTGIGEAMRRGGCLHPDCNGNLAGSFHTHRNGPSAPCFACGAFVSSFNRITPEDDCMSDNMIWNPAIDDDPGFSTAPTDRARAGAHATPSPMVEPPRSIADVVAALTTDGFVEVLA